MKVTESADLPAAPDEVFALRATEGFQEEKCIRSASVGHSVAVTEQGGRTLINTTRSIPTDSLPDVVRKTVGRHLRIHEVQDWGPAAADGARVARIDIEVEGVPVTLKGSLTLAPAPAGSHQHFTGDLKAALPFIGGKIEKAAAPAIKLGFDLEAQIIEEWHA